MFKRIVSKVPQDATIGKEIRKEFGPYFDKAEEVGTSFINRHPKQVFIAMIVIIVFSLIISFLVFTPERRKKEIPEIKDTADVGQSIIGGLGNIMETGAAVKDIYSLKSKVQEVLAKPKLTKEDSLFLEKAIIQLENQNKHLSARK